MKALAVLMTCHNRCEKTLECLDLLFKSSLDDNYKLEVFLVDDGSTDGTSISVKEKFNEVEVIIGDGSLYWNKGMRLAWDTANEKGQYDYFIWLNDDTLLDDFAIRELLNCHNEAFNNDGIHSVITGACRKSDSNNEFSYGGRTMKGDPVAPKGSLQECSLINGNVALIPKEIYHKIGNLSADYTHAMGDYDYGLRTLEAGFKNYTTKKYIAICPTNDEAQWSNPNISLVKRLKLFNSPKGLNIEEYLIFRKKYWKKSWMIFAFKAYAKVLFPTMYKKVKG